MVEKKSPVVFQNYGAFHVVPEAGIEPAWYQVPGDFESPASTNSTTPASLKDHRRTNVRVYYQITAKKKRGLPLAGRPVLV